MKVLQIKFILFIFNVKYVPFLNFHKSLKLFEDNELHVHVVVTFAYPDRKIHALKYMCQSIESHQLILVRGKI